MKSIAVVALVAVPCTVWLESVSFAQEAARVPPRGHEWVPFQADVRRTTKDGTRAVGRFFRSRDGTTRAEMGPSIEEPDSIAIRDLGSATVHFWTPDRGWRSYEIADASRTSFAA